MKNKKLTYILIPVVILIWGLVIYRIFFENRKTLERAVIPEKVTIQSKDTENKEQYTLIANYRDPFLSNAPAMVEQDPENEKKENEQVNLRRQRAVMSNVRWPDIKYGGFIKNDKENKYTILFSLQNQNYLVNVGDTIHNIYIKAFYRDSILVVYSNEEKIVKK